ncbi:Hypothetical protein CINCED_3A020539 [Cinara cedri]|uniref:Uncharacterized protein n=1 Tax=Cinara cedri TaxID=506608 RepID=A0A5E4N2M8_9HEMI|nr:Hypothetical protein CINCED_3A020539 [Cinara cedri]
MSNKDAAACVRVIDVRDDGGDVSPDPYGWNGTASGRRDDVNPPCCLDTGGMRPDRGASPVRGDGYDDDCAAHNVIVASLLS